MNPHHAEVARRASHRCEYCHAPEVVFNLPFEVEHVVPLVGGGYGYGADYGSYPDENVYDDSGYDSPAYGNSHVRWCMERYRSYNARYNTWVSYDGDVRQCVSPYS